MIVLAGALSVFFLTRAKADANEKAIGGAFKAVAMVKAEGKEAVRELKVDGCDPSSKNTRRNDLIEYRLDAIDTKQTAIQADTQEILKRLPK